MIIRIIMIILFYPPASRLSSIYRNLPRAVQGTFAIKSFRYGFFSISRARPSARALFT